LEIHGVSAEAGRGGAEADARAGGILEEGQGDGLAAERGEFFQGMTLDFLEGFALVEEKGEFVRIERFESKQIAKPMRHIFLRIRHPNPHLSS
jgi:hypothetical protein